MTGGAGRRWWLLGALTSSVASLLFLAAAYGVLERPGAGPGSRAVGFLLIVWSAATFLLAMLLVGLDRLVRWWTQEIRLAQRVAVIDSLPPGLVIDRLLSRVYGNHAENQHIARGVIGGAGYAAEPVDLSVASAAEIRFQLRSETPDHFSMTTTVDYTFDVGIPDRTLVLLATSEGRLRSELVQRCKKPLFDWIYVPDAATFATDPTLTESLEVGVRYLDDADGVRETEVVRVAPDELNMHEWPTFVALDGGPEAYVGRLRVSVVDLAGLARPEEPISSVVGLTLRSTSIQPASDVMYWQPPFPCRISDFHFDLDGLTDEEGRNNLEFQIVPFLPTHTFVVQDTWVRAQELRSRRVDSWALPGHGIALLWRVRRDGEHR